MPTASRTPNWNDVAATIRHRMTTLALSEQQLATRSRVSLTTVKELTRNTTQRHRHHSTLPRLSQALDLDPDHLGNLAGHTASLPDRELQAELEHTDLPPGLRDLILHTLAGFRAELHQIRTEHDKLTRTAQTQLRRVETLPANTYAE
ncbi:hypothetical protein [Actinokineospora globicatena]|uniref:hypothetical protein n=1 Tax=Actinokineospora globicatena TaxID=103729 RepID=UPI0020A32055|nr:hypothetical protein [Actinokineospora globicatena]MCP2304029.1 hypothetical protein [Actinokineospora globicatena]GLW78621.1 hypothetical protein Aglo01_31030 [Actinokineospora globicatena]GLW84712.1 hypothetical protein Aglo02_23520 [Actinokineospora globicatena]